MGVMVRCSSCILSRFDCKLRFAVLVFQIILLFGCLEAHNTKPQEQQLQWGGVEGRNENIVSHSCIHDQILEQRKRPGRQVYSITPQVYEPGHMKPLHHKGRALLGVSTSSLLRKDAKQAIRIYLNYDAVGHSPDRDCREVGDIVKLGEPPLTSPLGLPSCNPHGDPPIFGDCWYNCTSEDISGEDKKHRLRKALGQTADWFRRALAVEPVKGNLRLSGYSACGQDGGVQLPREYVEEGVVDADLVLLVTTRPTTGNTLAWAVACERDQWGRAIAGHVNVAPRHLTAEAETLLYATLIHEVMHVLGFDPHAFAHFRDERKRRRNLVTEQIMDEKLGRMVTRVVLPRVVMHSRHHYGAFSENFTGLELEDGGGRGTSGSHWEKRLLMNEIMTGSVDTRSVVSKMTLALLEDSGWYSANYSMADHLDWGHNQGTEFVTLPCNLWKGAYHCNRTQLSGCTYNREAEGYCPIVTYSADLPQWAQYFPQANKGGQSSLADYCTYFVAYSDGSCTDINSARAPDRMLGEVRGSNSRCMASSLVRMGFIRGSMTQGNGCYQHRCTNNSLEVAVDGIWKVCPQAGELICPAYHELCSTDTVISKRELAYATLHFNDPAPAIAMVMVGASPMGFANVKMVILALTARLFLQSSNYYWISYLSLTYYAAVCDEQCSLHGGVCDNGVCEFCCSDYAGYTCQNSSMLLSNLSVCKNVLGSDVSGQHCAPSEPSILQQLEEAVVMPNYHRLFPGGARKLFNIFGSTYCNEAAKRLACWISIQKCDEEGDNRLRVCHSACQSYNLACGASLDCSDQTLFSSEEGQCTGAAELRRVKRRARALARHHRTPILHLQLCRTLLVQVRNTPCVLAITASSACLHSHPHIVTVHQANVVEILLVARRSNGELHQRHRSSSSQPAFQSAAVSREAFSLTGVVELAAGSCPEASGPSRWSGELHRGSRSHGKSAVAKNCGAVS
ncbi:Leishmanolysin-like peptidase [Senna tora]|uniref:Leishmanolysin-like peptidase n=1 Tax=Senna tora TaxID=362788 RepID=A0A834WCJ9_9FABA|nr:Leishmanolysin-like peptidase [Senna tora]